MRLVHSQAVDMPVCPPLTAETSRVRLRPGERPVWADATAWESDWKQWRVGAHRHGVGLDIAIGCLLEYALALDELERWIPRPESELRAAAQRELESPRLAPSVELRAWSDLLGGCSGISRDELPDVVLPARLMQNAAIRSDWGRHIELAHLGDALRCERAASRRGLTLEGWGLRVALELAADS